MLGGPRTTRCFWLATTCSVVSAGLIDVAGASNSVHKLFADRAEAEQVKREEVRRIISDSLHNYCSKCHRLSLARATD